MENIYNDFISKTEVTLESDISRKIFTELIKENIDNTNAFDVIFKYLKNDTYFIDFAKSLFLLFVFLVSVSIIIKCINNKECKTVTYVSSVVFTFVVASSIYKIILHSCKYIKDISTFFSVLSSTMILLSASGGNVSTVKAQTMFMPVFMMIIQVLINKLVPFCVSFFIGLAVIDSLGGEKKFFALSNLIKNVLYSVFAFITGIVFIIINVNFKSAMSTDSISAKTIRLLLSKAIPIVGGNISDAMNMLGGSIVSIKNSIGTVSGIFIVVMCIPPFLLLFGGSLMLSFCSFISEYFGIKEFKDTMLHIKCSIDFTIAALFVITVVVFVNISFFISVIPTVTV